MAPLIMVLTLVGVYSVNNSVFDIWVMLVMGVFGYLARKLKFDLGPLLLAFVLGPIMERSLRQALLDESRRRSACSSRPRARSRAALMAVAILFRGGQPGGGAAARRKRSAELVTNLEESREAMRPISRWDASRGETHADSSLKAFSRQGGAANGYG